MKNYRISLWAALPLVLAACSAEELLEVKQQETINNERIPVQVNFTFGDTVEADTRAATNVNNTSFGLKYSENNNSIVCLMADDGTESTYAPHQYKVTSSTSLAAEVGNEIYFPSGGNSVNVYGWYPFNDGSLDFTIQTDQSAKENYCLSDVLLANKGTSTLSASNVVTPASLEFHHAMAKIVLNIRAASGITVTGVAVNNVKPSLTVSNSAGDYYNTETDAFKSGVLTTKGDATSITAYTNSTGFTNATQSVACVIPPQTIVAGSFLTLTLSDASTIQYNLSANQVFSAKTVYTINIQAGVDMADTEQTIGAWQVSKGTAIVFKVKGDQLKYTEVEGDDATWTETTELTIGDESVYKVKSYIVNSSGNLSSKSMKVYSSNNEVVRDEDIVRSGTTYKFRAIGQGVTYLNFTYDDADGVAMGTASLKVTVTTNFATSLSQLRDKVNAADSENNLITAFYMGYYVHNNGDITLDNATRSSVAGDEVVGVITATSKSAVDTRMPDSRILVMALEDVEVDSNTNYNTVKYSTKWSETESVSASSYVDDNSYRYSTEDGGNNYLNGITLTEYLKDNGGTACALAYNYTGSKPSGTSNWFLPSRGQFKLIKDKDEGLRSEFSSKEMRELIASFSKIYRTDLSFWTSTEYGTTGKKATVINCTIALSSGSEDKMDTAGSGKFRVVRPFFVY